VDVRNNGLLLQFTCWPGSSVGIATGYGLDSPGIKSRWDEISRSFPDRPWGPPILLYNGYQVFPGGKEWSGRDLIPHTLLVPWSRNSTAILLLPLWAVRPVHSLRACATVQVTLTSNYNSREIYLNYYRFYLFYATMHFR